VKTRAFSYACFFTLAVNWGKMERMKKSEGLGILAAVAFLSAGCAFSSFAYIPYTYGTLASSDYNKEEKEGYYKAGAYSAVSSLDQSFTSYSDVYRDKYDNGSFNGHLNLPSTGEQKLLVIPVDFSDYSASEKLPSNSKEMLEQSFFGSDAHSQFYSVASYFDKASYGHLHLSGKVTSWYRSSYTYSALEMISGTSKNIPTLRAILSEAKSWYASTYPDDPIENYCFLDPKGNKVPAIYFVYACPTADSSASSNYRDSMLWAFTINNPAPTSWSGFDLTYLKDGQVDSHTYIHEMGHILGLKDYYDVNGSTDFGACSPTGRMDMMDYSLGDESPYSKLILDWTRPYVPTASSSITLRPFNGSGDCILIPASSTWSGSPFDEYLLLCYYTPSYLNRVDSTLRSEENRLFQHSGVEVYHVDSRLGYFDNKTSPKGYLDASISTKNQYKVDIANDNSSAVSGAVVDTSSTLLQLLDQSSGSSKLIKNYVASDHIKTIGNDELRDSLFYEGSSFRKTTFLDLTFHNGFTPNFSFEIAAITPTSATVQVTLA
jgi:M6 family metalloprotease-like protein